MMKNKKLFKLEYLLSFLFTFVFLVCSYSFSFGLTYFLKNDSDRLAYLIDDYTRNNSCDFVHFSFENENGDVTPASNTFFRKTFDIDTSSGSLHNCVYAYTETDISDATIDFNGVNHNIELNMAASDIGHCFDFSFTQIVPSSAFHKVTFSKKLLYELLNKDQSETLSNDEIEMLQNTIFRITYNDIEYDCVCYAIAEKSKNQYFDHFLDMNFVIFHEPEIQLNNFTYELITVAGHERLRQLFTVFSDSGHKLESLNFYTYLNNVKDTSIYQSCFKELRHNDYLKLPCILIIAFSSIGFVALGILFYFKRQKLLFVPIMFISLIVVEIIKNLIIRLSSTSLIIFYFLSPIYVLPLIAFAIFVFFVYRRMHNE